jgi:hypothetical protein
MRRWALWACLSIAIAAAPAGSTGVTRGRTLPPTLFGANCEFYEHGLYYGTLPNDQPGSRRMQFASLLRRNGITTLRFPGGWMAGFYFWNSEGYTRTAARAVGGHWLAPEHVRACYNYYTTLDQLIDFCRFAGIGIVYQLNTQTAIEDHKLFLLSPRLTGTDYIGLPQEGYFDPSRDLLGVAAQDVERLVRYCREREAPVRYWEMGNEEYDGSMAGERYADIVDAYARAVLRADPAANVLVTLGHNGIINDEDGSRQWALRMVRRLRQLPTADRIEGFTLHYAWRNHVAAALEILRAEGFGGARIAITEFTCGWPDYWEETPRFSHALAVADYLVDIAKAPEVDVVTIHDLVSQNFGVFHYNQRPFVAPWDPACYDPTLGYVATPTALTYRLFRELHGGTIIGDSPHALEVLVGDDYRAVVANQADAPRRHTVDLRGEGLQVNSALTRTLQAADLRATEAWIRTRRLPPQEGRLSVDIPPHTVVCVLARCVRSPA